MDKAEQKPDHRSKASVRETVLVKCDWTGKVTFLTYHYWNSKRRAGFHGLAQAFCEAGWRVRFVTTGLSRISFLKTDPRIDQLEGAAFNRWNTSPDGVDTFVYCPIVHPFARFGGTDWITNHLFAKLYKRQMPESLAQAVTASDLIIFESSPALLLFEDVCSLAPEAKLVYRVSDDVRVIGMAPAILAAEDAALERFDLVSVPSRILLEKRFGHLSSAQFHAHGIDVTRLEAARYGPMPELERPSCVALGTTLFDVELLAICAKARSDVNFYIVGGLPAKKRVDLPNVIWCGERPFEEALKMAAAADMTAAFYRPEMGAEYLAAHSNKIAQYMFFGKPILGPNFLSKALSSKRFHPINPANEEGADLAICAALSSTPLEREVGRLRSWSVVRDEILEGLSSR